MSGLAVVLVILGFLLLSAIIGIVLLSSGTPAGAPSGTTYRPPSGSSSGVPTPVQTQPVQKQTGVWKCVSDGSGNHTAVRIDSSTGRVQCISQNARDCMWTTDLNVCRTSLVPNAGNPDIRPASCTADQEANLAGWCGKALQLF